MTEETYLEDDLKVRYERAMHYWEQEKECSKLLREQRDKAWAELEEAKIQLKRLAPTGRYNDLDIEGWHKRATVAEERLERVAKASRDLNSIRADIDGALGYGGMATLCN